MVLHVEWQLHCIIFGKKNFRGCSDKPKTLPLTFCSLMQAKGSSAVKNFKGIFMRKYYCIELPFTYICSCKYSIYLCLNMSVFSNESVF